MKPEAMSKEEYHNCMQDHAVWDAANTIRDAINKRGAARDFIEMLGSRATQAIQAVLSGQDTKHDN